MLLVRIEIIIRRRQCVDYGWYFQDSVSWTLKDKNVKLFIKLKRKKNKKNYLLREREMLRERLCDLETLSRERERSTERFLLRESRRLRDLDRERLLLPDLEKKKNQLLINWRSSKNRLNSVKQLTIRICLSFKILSDPKDVNAISSLNLKGAMSSKKTQFNTSWSGYGDQPVNGSGYVASLNESGPNGCENENDWRSLIHC